MNPTKNTTITAQGAEGTGSSVLPPDAERKLKKDAGAAVEAAKEEIRTVTAEAGNQAGAVIEEAKAEIGKVADKAKGMANEQKDYVSQRVEDVAAAVNKVAGELEQSDSTTASYARTVADTVSQFSDTIKNKDVDELLAIAEDFGRKQPAAFMAAAALMGFAASRFLVASSHRRPASTAQASASTSVGDGGISGNYPGPSRREASASTRDSLGGSI